CLAIGFDWARARGEAIENHVTPHHCMPAIKTNGLLPGFTTVHASSRTDWVCSRPISLATAFKLTSREACRFRCPILPLLKFAQDFRIAKEPRGITSTFSLPHRSRAHRAFRRNPREGDGIHEFGILN